MTTSLLYTAIPEGSSINFKGYRINFTYKSINFQNGRKAKIDFKNIFMKSSFIVFAASFFLLPLQWQHNNIESREPVLPDPFLLTLKSINKDSSNSIRIINASSLKRLPAVIMDLSTAFNGSIFQDGYSFG